MPIFLASCLILSLILWRVLFLSQCTIFIVIECIIITLLIFLALFLPVVISIL